MGFNINISRNLEPYDKQFGGKVTFYKDVKFEKSITISGDLIVNGNITAAGSSGLTAENLKGGEQGSIPYQDGVNSTTFLPPTNAAGRFLKSNGPGQDPEWVALGGGQGALNLDDLQDVDNDVANVTNGQIIRYNSSTSKWERFTPNYLTAETSHADVVIDGDFTSEGLMKRGSSAGSYSIVADNSSNWNTAFGWGNHATEGYIEDSDFSSNGFMKRTGAGTYAVDGSTYISDITGQNIGDLANVNVSASPTFGHILKWTGSAWTAEADAGGSAGAGVDGAPAGTVSMWSGTASSVPNGYLLCDGSAVSRVAYTDLFNAIGTAHGAGDGSTTFNLPNLRNRFVVGEGTSYALAATGGSADATLVSHSHTVDSHSHSDGSLSVDNHSHSFSANTSNNTHNHGINDPGHIHNVAYSNSDSGDGVIEESGQGFNGYEPTESATTGITINNDSHSHSVSGTTGNSNPGVSGNTGSSSPGTNSQGSSATNANLPPYYALCYVIKVTSGGAITATDSLTLTSTDAGAAAAPTITLTRDSATPAANDIIGQIDFRGEDDASNSDSFAKIQGKITDPTSGSEDGTLEVVVKTGGNDQTIAFPTTSGTLALTSDLGNAFPSGGIIMWSGAEGDIPNGWLLCNGQGSTPDLRNRFVVGAGTGSSYSVDDTGGSADATLVSHSHNVNGNTNNTGDHSHSGGTNNTGDHSHSGNTSNTGGHSHNTNTAGGHSHSYVRPDQDNSYNSGNPIGDGGDIDDDFINANTSNAGAHSHNTNNDGSHSHNVNINNAGSHSHNVNINNAGSHSHNVNGNTDSQGSSATGANRPPYYALCFIMKT